MPSEDLPDAIDLRREFHEYPEPSWCEFHTTSRLVDLVEAVGVDECYVGEDAIDPESRLGVPEQTVLDDWHEKAARRGARDDVLDAVEGGATGLVAVLERGDGPVVGLRVDIDALPVAEPSDADHEPAAKGFRSVEEGIMHACGHDAHMAIGLGTLAELADREFDGTLKVFFQPAEEVLGGGEAMVNAGHIDDVDSLFAVHVGFGYSTGTVVAGAEEFLAIRQRRATFTGESAHAGAAPQDGRNAMQAMATAVQNLHAIPRHADALTRVNVGRAEAGRASNVVAERAVIELEARAGTNPVLEAVDRRVDRVLEHAAGMYDCELSTETIGRAPRVDSDPVLASTVCEAAAPVSGVEEVRRRGAFGASEDATYFMDAVAANGGQATYVIVGTDHPSGHHTPRFDVDEPSIDIGTEVLAGAIEEALST
ncbi:amidohydrolase [Halosimplex carlsbadense 2-9-1]|uniref:Amidohydrolase n=1 Tax=Halosimplex carlsbadense 2-9-1 TaxID=797114 RepID=M0CWE8_9EURY|nr:amidohydrolase [Halosimplex carlsbadense]ELZ27541.1 amidohydrolase [Halosimplex carlsbadense 2-9-1]